MDIVKSKFSPPKGPFQFLDENERQNRLRAIQDTRPDGPLWVFAFGSLMWNPCFEYARCEVALLSGWERKFHMWSTRSRGTPERPGLGLCIEKGQSTCKGLAYQLKQQNEKVDWPVIWDREMVSGIYHAVWADMALENGETVKALTFVIDPDHYQYVNGMTISEMSEIISEASGVNGLCRDYLASTVEEMAKIGVEDDHLTLLLAAVKERVGSV